MWADIYTAIFIFVAFYPIVTSVMWLVFSVTYKIRWEEMHHEVFPKHVPRVSVLVPVYNEERLIESALLAMSQMTYPNFEIIVINDGSTDGTFQKLSPFLKNANIRLIDKKINQGKSLALNDALPLINGEVIVVLDADAEPEPDLLQHLTWHFQHARVGAVTGHPRVKNTTNFLTRIQVIDFTSIIGLLRRSQRIWGRIITVSGIVAAFRKEALFSINGFRPDMYTEDIDVTWRLEKKHWDVRYEPRAIVWMHVPDTLRSFFKQRLRWARGLMQVLRVHKGILKQWSMRRMWTIFYEAIISILWNTLYGLIVFFESAKFFASFYSNSSSYLSSFSSYFPYHEHLIFNYQWIVIMMSFSLLQLTIGGLIEIKHDRDVVRFFPYIILYPAFYWIFMVVITWLAMPILWREHKKKVDWSSERQ